MTVKYEFGTNTISEIEMVLALEHNWAGTVFNDTIARPHTFGLPRIPQPVAPCLPFGSWAESGAERAARRARAEVDDAVFRARTNLYGELYLAKKAIQDLERAAGRKSGSGEAALLRKELVKMCQENDRLRRIDRMRNGAVLPKHADYQKPYIRWHALT